MTKRSITSILAEHHSMYTTPTNPSDHWDVMNQLEEAFSNINAISFMLEELTTAMDNHQMDHAHDVAHALNAFLPVYTHNWDTKFKRAWNDIVK